MMDSGAATADSGKVDSGFEVTLDSDVDAPELLASSTTITGERIKYFSMRFIDGPSLKSQLSAGHNFNCFVHAAFWTIAPPVL